MRVQFLKEMVIEMEVNVEEKGKHCFVADVDHQAVALDVAVAVGEIDHRGKVLHALFATDVREAVGADDEAVEGLGNEGEGILWVYTTEIGLQVFLILLLRSFFTEDCANILRHFFEAEALHSAVFTLGFVASHQVRVQNLSRLIIH